MHLVPLELPSHPTSLSYQSNSTMSEYAHSTPEPGTVPVQKLLRHIFRPAKIHVSRTDALSLSVQKLFVISTAERTYYTLKTKPSRSTRLLRHESSSFSGEAHTLDMISRLPVPVPRLLSSSNSSSNPLSSSYLLRSYIPHCALSKLTDRLSAYDQAQISRTLGTYFRHIISLRMPSFGTTDKVLRSNGGHSSWRNAFHSLMESGLRDAEDMVISLPYESIRYYVSTNLHLLDAVREARLVPLRAGTADTVLVDDESKAVVGILGWVDVIWGDPLLGEVFATADADFWAGFGGHHLLESGDGEDAKRGLIYTIYRSTIAIVAHRYRPHDGADESEARRTLVWALDQLASS